MIAIGSDHAGYDLKQRVIEHLKSRGLEVHDYGCYSTDSTDYPIYGRAVGVAVATGVCDRGIVICSTGIGISITANKVKGIRAALCADVYSAQLTRLHNNANVLALGRDVVGVGIAMSIVDTFLDTEFSGVDRHARRVSLIEEEIN